MIILTDLIKKLRSITGVGILDCKKALLKNKNNLNYSIDYLREKGKAKALNKISRKTLQGSIFIKIKNNIGAMLELNCETDFVEKDKNFIKFGNEIVLQSLLKKITDINILRDLFESKRLNLISIFGENINISKFLIISGEFIHSYIHRSKIGVLLKSNSNDNNLIKYISMHIAAKKPLYLNPENIPKDIISKEKKIQLSRSLQTGKSISIAKKIVIGRMNKFISEISLIKQSFVIDPKKTVEQYLLENSIKLNNFARFEVGELII
ncbi:MAG: elongation factor Ts [Buchnera aphidicola (Periphyllus lyropictus)]|uniref:translation elongation factor Ts n=1 Tax=Buchnera aphidicola TaxID=9 RepID=UPI001ED6CE81|nr:translation elongation factor Ts [Buchnera aphidicola]NIH16639.1 elongation factor Ts [Buchnera aphidicola (Periphyllus lyropictus)]USS94549.1 translation elongation factor Ts [Buchnera aphidicola (Periphyllus lyropictus)]